MQMLSPLVMHATKLFAWLALTQYSKRNFPVVIGSSHVQLSQLKDA